MSASLDTQAIRSRELALVARRERDTARREHHEARLRFLRDARAAGWSWQRIGAAIGLTDRGAARYWSVHRMEASRLGPAQAIER